MTFLTVQEAAAELGVTDATVRRLLQLGRLSGGVRVDEERLRINRVVDHDDLCRFKRTYRPRNKVHRHPAIERAVTP